MIIFNITINKDKDFDTSASPLSKRVTRSDSKKGHAERSVDSYFTKQNAGEEATGKNAPGEEATGEKETSK